MTNAAVMNSLAFSVERKGDSAFVHCRGRLVAGLGGDFYAKIMPLFADSKRVVLDLTDLDSVDSMGLGTLVRLMPPRNRRAPAWNSMNLNKKVRDLLGITNLLSLFGDMCEKGVAMKF